MGPRRTPLLDHGGRARLTRLAARSHEQLTAYLMVAPQVLGWVLLVCLPLVGVAWYSLNDWNVLTGQFTFIGIDNYVRMVADPAFISSLWVSVKFSIGLVIFNLSVALLLAVLLNQRIRGVTMFRTFFFAPVVVSLVAWSIVWGFLLQDDGGVNALLSQIGIDGPNWLREPVTALIAMVVVQTFKGVGVNMVLFLAALQGVPAELKEAAQIDGARPSRVFRSITLPMISPTILLVSIITLIGSLEVFALVDVMTGGGPGDSTTVLAFYLYQQAFEFSDFGYASALGVVMFVVIMLLTLLQWRSRKRWVHDEV